MNQFSVGDWVKIQKGPNRNFVGKISKRSIFENIWFVQFKGWNSSFPEEFMKKLSKGEVMLYILENS